MENLRQINSVEPAANVIKTVHLTKHFGQSPLLTILLSAYGGFLLAILFQEILFVDTFSSYLNERV